MKVTKCLKGLAAAAVLSLWMPAHSGNIPQYSFQETRQGFNFKFLENATPINNIHGEGSEIVFPDKQTITSYVAQGFPIGFTFRYAGKEFNQFAVNNNGYLLLGKDKVEFRGYANLFFNEATRYATNTFYLGMGPTMFGIKDGQLSYAVSGTEGNRVLTVEFAHMNVNEPSTRGNAIYSLQILLYEKDGKVEFNFLEEESPYSSIGLITGLYGWSNQDDLLLTSASLKDPAHVSEEHYADMLNRNSTLRWLAEDILGDPDEGHEDPYQFSLAFQPTGTTGFICEAPGDLNVTQRGDKVTVTCTRPADAPATAIMISEKPILEYPEQGVSYPVKNDEGEYITTFGDATLIYYSNDENPTAEFKDIKPSTQYYVKAFGVNGYPSYCYDKAAELEFLSSHPAPYILQATSAKDAINLKILGDDPVIIAATTDRVMATEEGATGIFGQPEAACNVGDEIEGGGRVIFVGDPCEFAYTDAEPNRQIFFRAWSLRNDVVSQTFINATGVTEPSMPYEPQLELYTLYEAPLNWISQTTHTGTTVTTIFMPRMRGANEEQPAVGGVSASGTKATLISPALNYGKNAELSFEWAMETTRDVSQIVDQMVVLPEGNEPGTFGAGHSFEVKCGKRGTENDLFKATEYTGTMTPSPNDPDHYISGTSEFLPVKVNLPEDENARITFTFSTEGFSTLYLRNIKVTGEAGILEVFTPGNEDVISAGEGCVTIISANGGVYDVVALDGRTIARENIPAGEGRVIALGSGMYIVAGQKVLVK